MVDGAYQMRAQSVLPDLMVGGRTGCVAPLVPPPRVNSPGLSAGRCSQLPLTPTSTLSHARVVFGENWAVFEIDNERAVGWGLFSLFLLAHCLLPLGLVDNSRPHNTFLGLPQIVMLKGHGWVHLLHVAVFSFTSWFSGESIPDAITRFCDSRKVRY